MRVTDVFTDPVVTVVATPRKIISTAQFEQELDEPAFNQDGWRVWRRLGVSPDTLSRVPGYRPYLVYATASATITIVGRAEFRPPVWHARRYHLIGFSLLNPVAFGDLFADTLHPVNRIFRLGPDGNWRSVGAATQMKDREACWIYASGPSTFYGPITVDFPGGPGGIDFADSDGIVEIGLENVSDGAATVAIEGVQTTSDLLIEGVLPRPDSLDWVVGGNLTANGLASGARRTLFMRGTRQWATGDPLRQALYRIAFTNHFYWLPIEARNPDLTSATVGAGTGERQGLWAGTVTFDRVSSITETGAPVQPTRSRAPVLILLHVDSDGDVSLLSQVTAMADSSLNDQYTPADVLVVDPAKLNFFDGVETRGGTSVGRRYETVAFAMPRDFDPATQASLVSAYAELSSATASEIADWLNARTSRPLELAETYHLTWPLEGALAPDSEVRTAAASPLDLDAFHRANPFRHAYHSRHGAGFDITRSLTIRFDVEQQAGELVGDYEEKIIGLGNGTDGIIAGGRIELNRVSEAGVLQ